MLHAIERCGSLQRTALVRLCRTHSRDGCATRFTSASLQVCRTRSESRFVRVYRVGPALPDSQPGRLCHSSALVVGVEPHAI
jgi:hypothetical protein